jgi:zinc protease
MNTFGKIHRFILENGLHILINPDRSIPKVSVQLWYNVGSKDELSGEKGLAHLLEHMIFKGTKTLSESDINLITQKLSGYTNAFTSYDYTGYMFDFPKQHWLSALSMLSDCMSNCTFDEDMLQSELKAVIQELKMYKDNYSSSLIETMTGAIFSDHPYHNPIIGYKQDLWSITREGLLKFYRKYYNPQHATLVVVGDVDPEQALEDIKAYFAQIPGGDRVYKSQHPAQRDVKATQSILYRDVQRPMLMYTWRVPGITAGSEFVLNVLAHIIGQSASSRLYRLLVDELGLATDVGMMLDDLFEHGLLFLQIDPIESEAIPEIEKRVVEVINNLAGTITEKEIKAAIKQVQMGYLVQGETLQERAYMIGKGYLASENANYINEFMHADINQITDQINALIQEYLRVSVMHKGAVMPLPPSEREFWLAVQEESDTTDEVILSRKVRTSEIESGKQVHAIAAEKLSLFQAPEPHEFTLPNGLKVLFSPFGVGEKIELILEFESQHPHDPEHLQGLSNFTFALLEEGTKNFTKTKIVNELADRGIYLDVHAGVISMTLMKTDLLFALDLLYELVQNALFDPSAIEKVRAQILSDIDDFWDEPNQFIKQLAREHVYKGHGYSKRFLGTKETVSAITREDITYYYRHYVTPHAKLAVVGAIDEVTLKGYVSETLGKWHSVEKPEFSFPHLVIPEKKEIIHPITRDQVVLAFAGLSVDRGDERYDALLVFDQFFSGGVTGSMSSRLFQLREQTGLFYTIGGSLVYDAGKQPGMFFLKTIVSQDRLAEAEAAIKRTMLEAVTSVGQEEFRAAKDAIAYSLIDQFATQKGIAQSFLFVDRMELPRDFYSHRIGMIEQVRSEEMLKAAREIMDPEKISTIKVGRL